MLKVGDRVKDLFGNKGIGTITRDHEGLWYIEFDNDGGFYPRYSHELERVNMESEIQLKIDQAIKDKEAIDKNISELQKQLEVNKIPDYLHVGMVFDVPSTGIMMVTSDTVGKYIMTHLEYPSGCWNSDVQFQPLCSEGLRDQLEKLGAIYLGRFEKVYKRV